MANNINITEGSGKTVSTEDVGGAQFQKIKVVGGETGSTSVWGVNPDRSAQVSVVGTVRAVITGGSVATVASGNQSVSGAVTVSGSVLLGSSNASIVAIVQGSIATAPSGNQSVSGTVGASVIGIVPVQTSNSSVITVLQNSSIIAVVTGSVVAAGNQSVSGSVNVSSILTIPGRVSTANSSTSTLGGNAAFTGTAEEVKDFAAIVLNVFADQNSATNGLSIQQSSDGTNWDLTDTYTITASTGKTISVQPSGRFFRVVYTNGAVAQGAFRLQTVFHTVVVKPSSQRAQDGYTNETDLEQQQSFGMVFDEAAGTWSRQRGVSSLGTLVYLGASSVVTRTVITSIATAGQVMGSVAALQGTNPWIITGSVQGNLSGSVAAFQAGTQITSLVSTVPSSVIVGASIFGQLPAGTAMIGSVAAYQGAVPWAVAGSVAAFQAGTQITSLVSTVPSSVIVGASIFGQLPAGTAVLGSVAALQGTNPWTVNGNISGSVFVQTQPGSVLQVSLNSASASVVAIIQANSIAGTYAEDTAYTAGDRGLFTLAMRNDLMSSITSADLDYSGVMVGPIGEQVVANSPITKWVQGTASMLGGTPLTGGSVAIIAAQGSSVFTYITALQVVNYGATTQFLRLDGATSSIVGFTIAPAGGGSNIYFPNGLKTNANAAFTASISGAGAGASVYLSAQGFISRT